ncbi:hypothetical protein Pan97_25100 [Bremerella volcania]|uniref:Uncharacterized protein n=1 Tax=Bremerella volcania TaxID=2527984 RepID=A0A518C8C2_9BACT|nr:VCBS domain-containing protein [Bremerella volcania]QDU75477.1 hypothetical protein Pan97_25100 [Bremerella volcania]
MPSFALGGGVGRYILIRRTITQALRRTTNTVLKSLPAIKPVKSRNSKFRARSLRLETMETRVMLANNLVADFNTDPVEYELHEVLEFQNKLFFVGSDRNGTYWNAKLRYYDPVTGEITHVARLEGTGYTGNAPKPGEMTVIGDQFFFRSHVDGGSQLWRYDSNANDGAGGASMVEDFGDPGFDSYPTFLTVLDGKLYFQAYTSETGTELWVLDPQAIGTENQTKLVADLVPGSGSSSPSHLTVFDGKLFFQANDGESGAELWVYDPQADNGAGSVSLFADIAPDHQSSSPQEMAVLNGILYFQATTLAEGAELWQYNPAPEEGEVEVTMIADIYDGYGSSAPTQLTVAGGKLYFRATDYYHGTELFVYDPEQGVSVAADIGSGDYGSDPEYLTELGGLLYFQPTRGGGGVDVRVIDPATGEMQLISVPNGSRTPENFGVFDGKLVFNSGAEPYYRTDVYIYDPQDESLSILYDPVRTGESAIWGIVEVDGVVYGGVVTDAEAKELWKFDPSANGGQGEASVAARIPGSNVGYYPAELTAFNGDVYFRTTTGPSFSLTLYRYDPDTNGPTQDAELVFSIPVTYPSPLTFQFMPADDRLYFVMNDRMHGEEIWELIPQEEGQPPIVRMVADLAPGMASLDPEPRFVHDGKLYFVAHRGVPGLWQYDPTANDGQGEAKLVDDLAEYDVTGITELNDRFYFGHDKQLWEYDPTSTDQPNTPRSLGYMGSDPVLPDDFVALGEKVYFISDQKRLWEFTPNAPAGEANLQAIVGPGVNSRGYSYYLTTNLVANYGRLYFGYAPETALDYELWEYYPEDTGGDGQLRQASNIQSDLGASPSDLMVIDGDVYFAAYHEDVGRELFVYSFNPEPVVGNDTYETDEDVELVIDTTSLLDNDFDYNSEDFSASYRTGPAHGQVTINPDGTLRYVPNPHYHGTDYFTYFVTDGEGATSFGEVFLTIHSQQDPATIGGVLTYTTHEDETLPISANLIVNDVDEGEAFVQPVTDQSGTYGTFSIDTLGQWTYQLNPADVQTLRAGDAAEDSFDVISYDGLTTETVTITIDGLNDVAILGGTSTGSTFEESTDDVTGTLSIDDPDQGESLFTARTSVPGTYGTFSVTEQGSWTFQLDNQAAQHLGQGESFQETFTVTSVDQAASIDVRITISGENDLPSSMVHAVEGFRIEQQLIHIPISASDIDQNNTQFTHAYRVVRIADQQVVDSGNVVDVDELTVTIPAAGQYRIELTTTDSHGGQTTSQREFSVGPQSTVALSISRDQQAEPGTISATPETGLSFHEWEEAAGHLWFTLQEGLPNQPFDFTFELSKSGSWLGDPQVLAHLGSELQWTSDENVFTGTLSELDLTGYQVGDRVLLATLLLPKDLQNAVGLPMDGQGAYPQATMQTGISLTGAHADLLHPFAIQTSDNAEFRPVIYDASDDGRVGIADFAQFIRNYGRNADQDSPDAYRFDYDVNGKVGLSDFALFIQHYGIQKSGDRPINMPVFNTPQPPAETQSLLESEPLFQSAELLTSPTETFIMPIADPFDDGQSATTSHSDLPASNEVPKDAPLEVSTHLDARLIDAVFQSEEHAPAYDSSPWDEELLGLITSEDLEDSLF